MLFRSVTPPVETPTEIPEVVTPPTTVVTYTVVSGDMLWKIAQTYGVTWEQIAEVNKLANPNLIFPGDVFVIPAK